MGMRALVIDDVLPIQSMMRKMLQQVGVDEVLVADTGEAGLRLLKQGGIDLLLLDIHLPDMSGLEVLQQVRSWDSELYVAVATGFEESKTVQEIVRLGANRYIVKPVPMEEIRKTVVLLSQR